MTIRLIWIVAYREDPTEPQQEVIRYTKEAANAYARTVIEQGGIAMVVEDEIQVPDYEETAQVPNHLKGRLEW